MEVRLFPHSRRRGVGRRPRRESQRPYLPQHARHCPVLEAGSALGYLVYPPLRKTEAFQIVYSDAKYHFTYLRENKASRWEELFRLTFSLAVGGGTSHSLDL